MPLSITRPNIPVPLTLARGGTEATTAAGARTNLQLGDVALLTAPGGTTTFLRADKTWAAPGGGSGDVSSTVIASVEGELALFTGTNGKLIKRGTGSGLANLTNGVLGIKASPVGAIIGTTDTQTLTNKTIAGASNTLTVREADLSLIDTTTRNVSISLHGFAPKLTGSVTDFLNGNGGWSVPVAVNYWSRASGQIKPVTTTDQLVLSDEATTFERLEVGGGIKVGNSTGTVDGIIRWTGTDLEVRKGGSWVSLTL